MRYIRAAECSVEAPIVLIHVTSRVAQFIAGCGVVDELRKCIVHQEREAVGKTSFRFEKDSVVSGITYGRIQDRHVAELRKWPQYLGIAGTKLFRQQLVCR